MYYITMNIIITKQLVHSFSVNIRISQPSKVMFTEALTKPDVNLRRMHQLYNDSGECMAKS